MKNTMFTCLWRVETRKKVMYYTMEWCCAYVASNNNIPPADITESHWKTHIVKKKHANSSWGFAWAAVLYQWP